MIFNRARLVWVIFNLVALIFSVFVYKQIKDYEFDGEKTSQDRSLNNLLIAIGAIMGLIGVFWLLKDSWSILMGDSKSKEVKTSTTTTVIIQIFAIIAVVVSWVLFSRIQAVTLGGDQIRRNSSLPSASVCSVVATLGFSVAFLMSNMKTLIYPDIIMPNLFKDIINSKGKRYNEGDSSMEALPATTKSKNVL